jgi:hypothetical protein
VVERVEFRELRVDRRILEVARAVAVEARRKAMLVSRAVSCSGVMQSSGFWTGQCVKMQGQ